MENEKKKMKMEKKSIACCGCDFDYIIFCFLRERSGDEIDSNVWFLEGS